MIQVTGGNLNERTGCKETYTQGKERRIRTKRYRRIK